MTQSLFDGRARRTKQARVHTLLHDLSRRWPSNQVPSGARHLWRIEALDSTRRVDWFHLLRLALSPASCRKPIRLLDSWNLHAQSRRREGGERGGGSHVGRPPVRSRVHRIPREAIRNKFWLLGCVLFHSLSVTRQS